MNRYTLYAIAALLFLGGLFATVDKGQINAMREFVGLPPLHRSEAEELSAGELQAEMARLGAMPVPGLIGDGPNLDETAEAVVACLVQQGAPEPRGGAGDGMKRYLLNLAALGMDPEAPLVEPKLRPLHPVLAAGPLAVLDDAQKGRLVPDASALLARYHRTYSDPDHPLYKGLSLHGGTFAGLDFEALTSTLASRWQPVAGCAAERALPPMAEWRRLEPG